jgi:hypothetical protein
MYSFLNALPRIADCQAACTVRLLHPFIYARFVSITKRNGERRDRKGRRLCWIKLLSVNNMFTSVEMRCEA